MDNMDMLTDTLEVRAHGCQSWTPRTLSTDQIYTVALSAWPSVLDATHTLANTKVSTTPVDPRARRSVLDATHALLALNLHADHASHPTTAAVNGSRRPRDARLC